MPRRGAKKVSSWSSRQSWSREPAGAPGAGPAELQLVQPHLHGGRVGVGGRAVLGKERARAGTALLFIEDRDGLLPGGALGVVDLTQVEDVALPDRAADAAALDDGPGAMLLAVLLAGAALEKHGGSVARKSAAGRGRVATTRTLGTSSAAILGKLTHGNPEKTQNPGPVAEVGLSRAAKRGHALNSSTQINGGSRVARMIIGPPLCFATLTFQERLVCPSLVFLRPDHRQPLRQRTLVLRISDLVPDRALRRALVLPRLRKQARLSALRGVCC